MSGGVARLLLESDAESSVDEVDDRESREQVGRRRQQTAAENHH